MKQQTLFDNPPRRRPTRTLMHVADAGPDCTGAGGEGMVVFRCARCGHETEWTPYGPGCEVVIAPGQAFRLTLSQSKRGIPCPRCNTFDPSDN